MIRKAVRLPTLLILVSSLLLAGCDGLPTNMEELFNWREGFVLGLTAHQVQIYLGGIIALAVVLVMAKGLFSLIDDLANDVSPISRQGKIAAVLVIFASVSLVYSQVEIANIITNLVLGDRTIDQIFNILGIGLRTAIQNIVVTEWSFGLTIILATMVKVALFCSLLVNVCLIVVSAFTLSNKVLWVIIAGWIGHGLFLKIFIMIVDVIGTISSSAGFGLIKIVGLCFYIGLTVIFWFVCYYIIPLSAYFLVPEAVGPRSVHVKNEKSSQGIGERIKNFDFEDIPTDFPGTRKKAPRQESEPDYEAYDDDDGIVDAEFTEIFPKIETGMKQLPEGGNYSPPPDMPNPTAGGNNGQGSYFSPGLSLWNPSPQNKSPEYPDDEAIPANFGVGGMKAIEPTMGTSGDDLKVIQIDKVNSAPDDLEYEDEIIPEMFTEGGKDV